MVQLQSLPNLSSEQNELLAALDVGDHLKAQKVSEHLSKDDLYALVVALHQSPAYRSQTSTDYLKPSVPKLPLQGVDAHAEDTDACFNTGSRCEGSVVSEHGGGVTLLAVGNNSSTETPRLDFGECNLRGARRVCETLAHQSSSTSCPSAKKQLMQHVIAAGTYDAKASLDLQVGESLADFNLLASRLGGVDFRMSHLGPVTQEPAAATAFIAAAASRTATHDCRAGPSLLKQASQEVSQSSTEPVATHSNNSSCCTSAIAPMTGPELAAESLDEAELDIPSCSSSPREAPSSCNKASKQPMTLVRQSAADMRASALVGPTSIRLDDVRDGEDASPEPTTPASQVALQAAPYPAATRSVISESTDREGSIHSTPSTIGSSISQHQTAGTLTEGKPRAGGGLGKVLFGPVNALRKSLTGNRDIKGSASTPSSSRRTPGSTAITPTAIGLDSESHSVAKVQNRIPSFTATAGATPSSSRKTSATGTPTSGYKPPSSASIASSRVAAATSRSPLGKQTQSPKVPAAAAGVARQPSDSSASAGLAWLQQQRDTPSPAVTAHSSKSLAHKATAHAAAAAEATSALIEAVGLKSSPVTPANSRPGTSHSMHSVASAATYAGSSARKAHADTSNSSRIPGFSATQQMVANKQQRSTPPSSARTATSRSARSTTSTATTSSTAAYMRHLSGVASGAPVAAGSVRTGSRLPSAPGAQQPALSTVAAASSRIGAGATSGKASAAAAASRRLSSRCDAHLQQNSTRMGVGGVSAAGKAAAAGAASQLRRSRSFGSLGELVQQSNQQDVSQIRQMWQKRAAAHKLEQTQQQQTIRGRDKALAQRHNALAARAARLDIKQLTTADGGSGIPAPEECESPPVLKPQGRSSSSSGQDVSTGGAAAAAVGYVPASELLGRLDDILEKARSPLDRIPIHTQHATPESAPPDAAYSAVSAAGGASSSGSKWAGSKAVISPASDARPVAVVGAAALQAAVVMPDSGSAKHGLGVNAQSVAGAMGCGPDQPHQQLIATDSSSTGRDQQLGLQLTANNNSINRQLF